MLGMQAEVRIVGMVMVMVMVMVMDAETAEAAVITVSEPPSTISRRRLRR